MKMKLTAELHKYLDTVVHSYCDYNVYSELKDLVFDMEQTIEDITKPNQKNEQLK